MLGLNEQQSFEGFITTSEEQCAQALNSPVGYRRKILDEEAKIYMLYKVDTVQRPENFNPFFRFVSSGSVVLLLELVSKMKTIDPTWYIVSSRTDNVYFEGSEYHFDELDEYIKTKWGFEDEINLKWVENPYAKWDIVKEKSIVYENHEPRMEAPFPFNFNGSLITGVAGCGKSRDMAKKMQAICVDGESAMQKVLMIAPTHKVRIAMEEIKSQITGATVVAKDLHTDEDVAVTKQNDNNVVIEVKNTAVSIRIMIFDQLKVLYAKGTLSLESTNSTMFSSMSSP